MAIPTLERRRTFMKELEEWGIESLVRIFSLLSCFSVVGCMAGSLTMWRILLPIVINGF